MAEIRVVIVCVLWLAGVSYWRDSELALKDPWILTGTARRRNGPTRLSTM